MTEMENGRDTEHVTPLNVQDTRHFLPYITQDKFCIIEMIDTNPRGKLSWRTLERLVRPMADAKRSGSEITAPLFVE